MIKADKITHKYTVWEGDSSYLRTALEGVSLEVLEGEFIAILGPNGSGKSTFAKHLNALLLPSAGYVWIDGKDSADRDNLWNIRNLVGMVFQNPDNQIIGTSVEEDVAFGPENKNLDSPIIREKVADSLNTVGLFSKRKQSPSKLSGGQKQHVAIAGVLASDSKCIVLDEPTAMLDPKSRNELMSVVHQLHQSGKTIILITHHVEETINADRIFLMNEGKVLKQGLPKEIFSDVSSLREIQMDIPCVTELGNLLAHSNAITAEIILEENRLVDQVMKAYSEGKDAVPIISVAKNNNVSDTDILTKTDIASESEVLMEVNNISFTYGKKTASELKVLDEISFSIRKGEFLGLIGSSGAGKTTLIKHLNGLLKADRGDILYKGKSIYAKGYALSGLRKEVGLVFQYPEQQLFEKTVLRDVCFGPLNMGMSEEEAVSSAKESLALVGIDESMYEYSPHELYGGQMRRVAIAGVLAMKPELLVMDEPTAGLDPGAKIEIFQLINHIRVDRGLAVLLISHDMDDIAKYSMRSLVLHGGRIVMQGKPSDIFTHIKELQDLGIGVPQVTSIMKSLQDRGLPLEALEIEARAACDRITDAIIGRGGIDA